MAQKPEHEGISNHTTRRHLLLRFRAGLGVLQQDPRARRILVGFLFIDLLLFSLRKLFFGLDSMGDFAGLVDGLLRLTFFALTMLGILGIILYLGTPSGSLASREVMRKIGLVNHAGEVPLLVAKEQDKLNPRLTIWTFDPCGISLSEWEDHQENLEAGLNVTIAKMAWASGRELIQVYAVPAMSDLPSKLQWSNDYLSPTSFVLVLGQGLAGPVTVDLTKIPHVLLGGSTGSGKSVLLKLLLMQALHKGASVFISDFKGGVDFPHVWHERCRMCFEEHDLLAILSRLVEELEGRKELFHNMECPNLDTYNSRVDPMLHLGRFIFACDEIAEVLDKTGLNKEQKELLGQIESKLSTIARQGRAFGIHLILATQRPDANILPGQIKNNIDCRVCGRADNVLSQIILDCADAADRVPKDIPGRFLTSDGTLFQAYWFDDSKV